MTRRIKASIDDKGREQKREMKGYRGRNGGEKKLRKCNGWL